MLPDAVLGAEAHVRLGLMLAETNMRRHRRICGIGNQPARWPHDDRKLLCLRKTAGGIAGRGRLSAITALWPPERKCVPDPQVAAPLPRPPDITQLAILRAIRLVTAVNVLSSLCAFAPGQHRARSSPIDAVRQVRHACVCWRCSIPGRGPAEPPEFAQDAPLQLQYSHRVLGTYKR